MHRLCITFLSFKYLENNKGFPENQLTAVNVKFLFGKGPAQIQKFRSDINWGHEWDMFNK